MTAAARCRERTLLLPCEGERLLAVLAEPEGEAAGDLGVVVVVGGPQYRAGSHRLFVQLARSLAGAGFPVLRFDVRGMGDSSGDLPYFEHLAPDVAAAIDALQAARPQTKRVVLWGLCDGASAALLYLHQNPDLRVRGLCLLNPWVRSPASLARTHIKHYYRRRLVQREFWRKLLTGRVAGPALCGLWANLHATRSKPAMLGAALPFQSRMAAAWASFRGSILLVLSGDDFTAREFVDYTSTAVDWSGLLLRPRLSRHDVAQANHTFSGASDRGELEQATLRWLMRSLAY